MDKLRRKKLVNYILVCVFALLWIAAMIQYINTDRDGSVQSMAGIIESKELEESGFVVRCRGKIDTAYYTEQEKTDWLVNAAGILNVPQDGFVETERNDNITAVSYVREGNNAKATFKFITKETELSPEEISLVNYMELKLSVEGVLDKAFEYRELFKDLCSGLTEEQEITIEFSGKMDGRLDEKQMNAFADNLLSELSAKEVSSEFADGSLDLYAYSDIEEEYIVTGGEKVNINIVMAYDEIEDKTCVYLSLPVISECY